MGRFRLLFDSSNNNSDDDDEDDDNMEVEVLEEENDNDQRRDNYLHNNNDLDNNPHHRSNQQNRDDNFHYQQQKQQRKQRSINNNSNRRWEFVASSNSNEDGGAIIPLQQRQHDHDEDHEMEYVGDDYNDDGGGYDNGDRDYIVTEGHNDERGLGSRHRRRRRQPTTVHTNNNYYFVCLAPTSSTNSTSSPDNNDGGIVDAASSNYNEGEQHDDWDDDENHLTTGDITRKRKGRCGFTTFAYSVAVFGIVMAYWFHIEGPPGPPLPSSLPIVLKSHDGIQYYHQDELYQDERATTSSTGATATTTFVTWNDYISQHLSQWITSTYALLYDTPLHLIKWFFYCRYVDMKQLYTKIMKQLYTRNKDKQPLLSYCCPIPEASFIDEQEQFLLSNSIIGQPRAIQTVQRSIQEWITSSETVTTETNDNDIDDENHHPLILWFSGHRGTGKRTLTKLLSQMLLLDSCKEEEKIVHNTTSYSTTDAKEGGCSLLSLDAADYYYHYYGSHHHHHLQYDSALVGTVDNDDLSQLEYQILYNGGVSNANHGAVVMIQNADLVPTHVMARMLRQLKEDHHHQSSRSSSSLRGCCNYTVFVFVSNTVGLKSIARGLRQGFDENLQQLQPGLLLDMNHEIDEHFGQHSKSAATYQQQAMISTFIDAVVPFVPLTPLHMKTILERAITQYGEQHVGTLWSSLRVASSYDADVDAYDALLNANVEYVEWMHHERLIRTFSSQGAVPIETTIMPLIRTALNRCINKDNGGSNGDNKNHGGDESQQQSAVIDIVITDPSSSYETAAAGSSWSSWASSLSSSSSSSASTTSTATSTTTSTTVPQGVLQLCKNEDSILYKSCHDVCTFSLS